MMGRFLPLFLSLVGALHVVGVSGQSAAECIGRCTNKVRDTFKDLQCSDANAAPCFCKNPTFPRAILECSQSCGATMDMVSGYLTADFCKVQGLVKPSEAAAASSPAPATSAAPATSSVPAAQTAQTSSALPAASSTSAAAAASSSLTTASSAAAESTGSPTASDSSSTASDAAASATSSAVAAAGSNSNGLSQAAIAGIGIGIGAAVIAIAGIVIFMLLKGRKSKAGRHPDNMEISKPLPGSGRMYPNRENNHRGGRDGSLEKYGHDIEMMTNRYEDMVPRTQPRTLV